MDGKQFIEQQLTERLAALRPQVRERRRKLFLWCGGAIAGFLAVVVFASTRPWNMTAMEMYGVLPLVPFVLFAAMAVIAGWKVEAVENRIREVEGMIRDLYEVDG